MSDPQDRTLPATPARRAEAIERGGRPTVAGPASLLSLAALVAFLAMILPRWTHEAADLLRACLAAGAFAADPSAAGPWPAAAVGAAAEVGPADGRAAAARLAGLVCAAIAVPAAVVIAAHLLVDRPGFRPGRIAPAFRRVNPAAGLRRLLAGACPRAIAGLVMAMLCGVVGLLTIEEVMLLTARAEPPSAGLALGTGLRAIGLVLAACTALAIVRFLWARRRFERSIRMTPKEFEEERRRLEPASAIDWQKRPGAPVAEPRGRAGNASSGVAADRAERPEAAHGVAQEAAGSAA